MKLKHTSPWSNQVMELTFDTSNYSNNNNLYVGSFVEEEDMGKCPYGDITVNLNETLPKDCAYINTNNMGDGIVDEMIKAGIVRDTGAVGFSGWCQYPLVQFDMEKLKEYME